MRVNKIKPRDYDPCLNCKKVPATLAIEIGTDTGNMGMKFLLCSDCANILNGFLTDELFNDFIEDIGKTYGSKGE